MWCAVTPSSKKKKGAAKKCHHHRHQHHRPCRVLLDVGGVNQKCVARLSVRRCGGQPYHYSVYGKESRRKARKVKLRVGFP